MSYIRIPVKAEGQLPDIPSDDEVEAPAPIEATPFKCRRQIYGTLIACLGAFSTGTVFGWAAVALPPLKSGTISDDETTKATVASIFIFGAMCAGPVAGYLMYKLGRRMSTFCFAILFSIGWAMIPSAHFTNNVKNSQRVSFWILTIGRFITGFAAAGCLVICPAYVNEMCHDSVRTLMGSMVPLILVAGNTFCFAFGVFTPWWILSFMCMAVPMALSILVLFIPDSPRYLLTVQKDEEARKAFNWLNFGFLPDEQERMFKKLKKGVSMLSKNTNRAMKQSERKKRERRLKLKLTSRPVLHPLIISILLVFFQQGTGTNVMSTYTQDILEPGGTLITPATGTVIIGIVFFFSVVISILIVDRLGRKPLLLCGTMMTFLTQAILGVFFYFHYLADEIPDTEAKDDLINNYSWIPISCTLWFFIFYACGLGSVTWIIAVEINHPDFQEIAGSLDSLTYWLIAFISTATLPSLEKAIHFHSCFWIYSGISFTAFWFILFFVYETKGRTQEDIMAHYRGFLQSPGDDDDGEGVSLGSIAVVRKKHGHSNRRSNSSNEQPRRPSGDSAGSDFDDELETIFETESESVMTK